MSSSAELCTDQIAVDVMIRRLKRQSIGPSIKKANILLLVYIYYPHWYHHRVLAGKLNCPEMKTKGKDEVIENESNKNTETQRQSSKFIRRIQSAS